MLNNLSGWHFLIILAIVLLLFGAPKLPALAKSLGQSMKILRNEIKPEDEKNAPASTDAASSAEPTAPVAEERSTPPRAG